MRIAPRLTYCGLTVVLSNPSRFDLKDNKLLSGYAGAFFNDECLAPYANRYQCDIRTSDTKGQGLLKDTKGILLLGDRAFKEWTGCNYSKYTLNEQRGCPLENEYRNTSCVCSYLPQDCLDIVDHESKFNPQAQSKDEDKGEEDETEKHKGKTSRSNYGFWLIHDTRKLLRQIEDSRNNIQNNSPRRNGPQYNIYPSSKDIIDKLSTTKNEHIYLDIETDSLHNITCIGLGFKPNIIYVIPFIRYDYTLGYSNIYNIYRALAIALSRNTIVTHNSQFDLNILCDKYKLPIGRLHYDTMLAFHRCFPQAEKSLGHAMSLFTWEPYHKDEGIFEPSNHTQELSLWEYNGKDVWGTMLVHDAIENYAKKIPGLSDSIRQSNDCVYPYLLNTLLGIRYSRDRLNSLMAYNDRAMTAYMRVLTALIGKSLLDEIRKGGTGTIASSSVQAVRYFHNYLNYKVLARTPQGKPSLNADSIYKLKLIYPNNPVLDYIIKYRERAKESGTLKFIPWKE
jgi:hypothetical protein